MENSYVFHTVIQIPCSRHPRHMWTNLKQFKEGNWKNGCTVYRLKFACLRLLVWGGEVLSVRDTAVLI